MNKILLHIAVIFIVLIIALALISNNRGKETGKDIRMQAITKAQKIYAALKSQGKDFSAGPCISESLMPDWVADIAHNPRQPVDDLPANQCPSFREGKAYHFVELDPQGKVINIY